MCGGGFPFVHSLGVLPRAPVPVPPYLCHYLHHRRLSGPERCAGHSHLPLAGLASCLTPSPQGAHTYSYGTVAYMPPELLAEGLASRAVDVYSFGVLLWVSGTPHHCCTQVLCLLSSLGPCSFVVCRSG